MQASSSLDPPTLFLVNATSLLVFAVAYIVAYSRKSNRTYWLNLTVANIVFAAAFIMFSQHIGASKDALLLPNCMLVIGLGFRWQAVRAFFGHRSTYLVSFALALLVAAFLYLADLLGIGLVFGAVNVIIAFQLALIIHALASEPCRHLPSRWGLAAAYGVVLASSVLRVVQGWSIDNQMNNLLPADVFLNIHLFSAAIHIVGSGAFALSMAYEQGTEELRQIAMRDPLTRLPNRLGLDLAVERLVKSKCPACAIFVIDIDNFKQINDVHGHSTGDLVIQRCGEVIGAKLRAADFVARVGGEEFVALVRSSAIDEVMAIAERIREAAEAEELKLPGGSVRFTVSIGVSYVEGGPFSVPDMIVEADAALYEAKKAGRNRVRPLLAPERDGPLPGAAATSPI